MTGPIRLATISSVVTFVMTPLIRRHLISNNKWDIPNHRSSHTQPVPRGGGLACAAGTVVGLAVAQRSAPVPLRALTTVTASALLGWADDHSDGLPPTVRLVGQLGAGAVLSPTVGAAALNALGTASIINGVNFMDGINGISAGTLAAWGLAAVANPYAPTSVTTLGAITTGVALGFLPWNAPKARIFLGDSGSYLLGGLVAAATAQENTIQGQLRVLSPLTLYATDTSITLIRRGMLGQPLLTAHRGHIYEQLVDDLDLPHSVVAAGHTVAAGVIALCWAHSGPRGAVAAITLGTAYATSPTWARRLKTFTSQRKGAKQ